MLRHNKTSQLFRQNKMKATEFDKSFREVLEKRKLRSQQTKNTVIIAFFLRCRDGFFPSAYRHSSVSRPCPERVQASKRSAQTNQKLPKKKKTWRDPSRVQAVSWARLSVQAERTKTSSPKPKLGEILRARNPSSTHASRFRLRRRASSQEVHLLYTAIFRYATQQLREVARPCPAIASRRRRFAQLCFFVSQRSSFVISWSEGSSFVGHVWGLLCLDMCWGIGQKVAFLLSCYGSSAVIHCHIFELGASHPPAVLRKCSQTTRFSAPTNQFCTKK